jgi:hypothetical protein
MVVVWLAEALLPAAVVKVTVTVHEPVPGPAVKVVVTVVSVPGGYDAGLTLPHPAGDTVNVQVQSPRLLPGLPVAVSVAVSPTFMVAGSPVNERMDGAVVVQPTTPIIAMIVTSANPLFRVIYSNLLFFKFCGFWLKSCSFGKTRPTTSFWAFWVLYIKAQTRPKFKRGPGLGPLLFPLIASAKPR